jgi:hypothetical protein
MVNKSAVDIEKMVEKSFIEVVSKDQKKKSGFKWFWESDTDSDEESKQKPKEGFFKRITTKVEKNIDGKVGITKVMTPTSKQLESLCLSPGLN